MAFITKGELSYRFLGYQTERDQLQRARSSAREKRMFLSRTFTCPLWRATSFETILLSAETFQLYLVGQSQPPPPQKSHPPRHAAPAPSAQRSQQPAPPPPQHKTRYPHRPAPQHRDTCPPRNNYGPSGNATGQTSGQPSYNSNGKQRAAPPRPRQKPQTLDFEIEEPDGRSYVVRGEATWRDFDPARDKVRKTG